MQLANATVLVTGANRGIGLAFARHALARGARRVYAAARDPDSVTLQGVVPLRLDVTKPEQVAEAARRCDDVTLVINNAGIAEFSRFLQPGSAESLQRQLDVNLFGPLRIAQAFAPVLARNGGGAFLNVVSVAAWIHGLDLAVYGATKSAAWALANGLRNELREQGTQVTALHMGFVDTDLAKLIDAPKTDADTIVTRAFDGLEAGQFEVLADEFTRQVKQGFVAEPPLYLQPR